MPIKRLRKMRPYIKCALLMVLSIILLAGCGFDRSQDVDENIAAADLEKHYLAIENCNTSEIEIFVNELLEQAFDKNTAYLEKLIDLSTDKAREVSLKAAAVYGTDEYEEEYHQYAGWIALNGLYKCLNNEVDHFKKEKKQFTTDKVNCEYKRDAYYISWRCVCADDDTYIRVQICDDYYDIMYGNSGIVDFTRENERDKGIFNRKKKTDKETAEINKKIKMQWFGSGMEYVAESSLNRRAYFYYTEDVINPAVAAHLDVAQNDGLNNALGWTSEQTEEIARQIRESDGNTDYVKERLLSYLNTTGSSEGYIGYDYLTLDTNENFEDGYRTFNIDMLLLNEISQKVFGYDYDMKKVIRR